LARWWDLQWSVKKKAFGSRDVFYNLSAQQENQLQREGESVIAAIRSGKFDRGLQNHCKTDSEPCKPPSFADELRAYVGPVGSGASSAPKLIQEAQYRFKHYVDPKYPPLAIQARIQGTVKLNLSVDPSTGRVHEVDIVLGHPLFRDAVLSAARQWQFEPGGFGATQSVPAELVFVFRCPTPLNNGQ
jgi:TonB family protein